MTHVQWRGKIMITGRKEIKAGGLGVIMTVLVSMCGILAPNPAFPETGPKQILLRADEARGNREGIEWRIGIESVREAVPKSGS